MRMILKNGGGGALLFMEFCTVFGSFILNVDGVEADHEDVEEDAECCCCGSKVLDGAVGYWDAELVEFVVVLDFVEDHFLGFKEP